MRPIPRYLLYAFGISWGIAALAYLGGLEYGTDPISFVIGVLFMMGPAIAALLVQRVHLKAPLKPLGLSLRGTYWPWIGITVLVGVSLVPLTLAFNYLLGGSLGFEGFGRTELSMSMLEINLLDILQQRGIRNGAELLAKLNDLNITGPVILVIVLAAGVLSAFTANVPFMLGEELGWRGALHHYTLKWNVWRQIAFTGLVWGVWHAPLIVQGHNYPEHPWYGVLFMILFTLCLSITFTWVRVRTRSVWGPVVLHGIINSTAGGVMLFIEGAHELLGSIAGVSGLLAIMTINGILLLTDRNALMRERHQV